MTRNYWPTNRSMRRPCPGLRGVVKISHTVINGISLINLDGFAPASQWEELSAAPASNASRSNTRRRPMTYSYTQISQYLSCPRRYRHRYLDGWQEKDTRAAMLFGRAFEQAVAALFRREDPAAVLFEQWSLCKDMGIAYSGNDTWDGMLQQGVQLLERFAQDGRVRIRRPRSSQQIQFNRMLGSGKSFVSYVDAIGELDGTPCVLEWKTSLRAISRRAGGHRRTGSPTRLLFMDDRHQRSRPDCFRPQTAGRGSVFPATIY